MYFYFNRGKQFLDLQGDLVITHNKDLVVARTKSAAPITKNANYVKLPELTRWQRIKATVLVVRFIWSKIPPITEWAPPDNVVPLHKRKGGQ